MRYPSWYLSRRTVLRAAGTTVALPFLEAMVRPGGSGSRQARAAGSGTPKRFLTIYGCVQGYVGRNDKTQGTLTAPWCPVAPTTAPGSAPIENNSYLKPFFDRKIESKISLLTGLTDRENGGLHGPGSMLLSRRPNVPWDPVDGMGWPLGDKKLGAPYVFAPSADQMAANHLRQFTAIPFLNLGIGPDPTPQSPGDVYCPWSWRTATEANPSKYKPSEIFDEIYGTYDPAESKEAAARRKRYRKSVLDVVRVDANRISGLVGRSDQVKLDQYLNSVRELELKIQNGGSLPIAGAGTRPDDSTLLGSREKYQTIMQDLIVQAFQTDRTRVAVLATGGAGTFLKFRGAGQEQLGYEKYRTFTGKPLLGDHHQNSHYDRQLEEIDNSQSAPPEVRASKIEWMEIFCHWSLEMYADLLGKMDQIVEGDDGSTVLDNVVCHWTGDDSDSASHGPASMPCVLGGRGGRTSSGKWAINAGRHVRFGKVVGSESFFYNEYKGTPVPGWPGERSLRDLLWGMLNIVGVPNADGSTPLKSFGSALHPLDQDLG